jgi:hypothetical protein
MGSSMAVRASANVVLPAAEGPSRPTRVGCPGSRLVIQSAIGRSASTMYDHSRRRVIRTAVAIWEDPCAAMRYAEPESG